MEPHFKIKNEQTLRAVAKPYMVVKHNLNETNDSTNREQANNTNKRQNNNNNRNSNNRNNQNFRRRQNYRKRN